MKTQHTLEPWGHVGQGTIWPLSGEGIFPVAETASHDSQDYKQNLREDSPEIINANRIIACVNGCKGIPNPETTVPELVAAVKEAQLVLMQKHEGDNYPEFTEERRKAYRLCEAVLAKAEGVEV